MSLDTRFVGRPRYPYQLEKRDEIGDLYFGRYYSATFSQPAIAVVASVSFDGEVPIDWAAYIGISYGQNEHETALAVARSGRKLFEDDARHYFPAIDVPYRK